MPAQILDSQIIAHQPGRYLAWPSISVTPAGELLAVFSGDRDQHVCPFGKTFLVRSSDRGVSWSAPELITNTPLDDRDGGIRVCRDGTILVTWFTLYREAWRGPEAPAHWQARMRQVTDADVAAWSDEGLIEPAAGRRGHWMRRSVDGGRTWEAPYRVPPTAPHGPIECADGRLLYVGNNAYERDGKTSALIAAESHDKGLTWQVIGRIPMFPAHPINPRAELAYFGEPHVVEAEPGRLVALTRYEERPNYSYGGENSYLWQFDSEDGGHTWTEPRPLRIWGKPPHLLRLHDDRLLVTYGRRHEPFGQRACLSHDGGRTWDVENEIILRDDAPNGDLGYPATAQCPDGTLVTVYYQIATPNHPPVIMATRWRV